MEYEYVSVRRTIMAANLSFGPVLGVLQAPLKLCLLFKQHGLPAQ